MPKLDFMSCWVGDGEPVYFIADIGANHHGELNRAKELIQLAKDAGANAVKFQNFQAPSIVSKYGFETLGAQLSHQSKWNKSVYEIYQDASLPWDWTSELKAVCNQVGVDYFSSPYDPEAVDMLDPYVSVYKIGSGDITWPEILLKIAGKGKPVILATGASEIDDVERAVEIITSVNDKLVLMQCNTNYTGSIENFKHLHLKVLKTYSEMFPDIVLGLSDHTPGHSAVLGAIALGARVIEKHFTDDNQRNGPDHPFAMNPTSWCEMINHSRELECALGSPNKFVADNERDTVIVQRRCLRARVDLKAGAVIEREMIDILRPAPLNAIYPYDLDRVIGSILTSNVKAGDYLTWQMTKAANDEVGVSP